MKFVCLHDKSQIERFLREDIYLNIYAIGDLDDFYWPHTVWYCWQGDHGIAALALLYLGLSVPTLLALSDETAVMCELLESLKAVLPGRFYAHLSPGLETVFQGSHQVKSNGEHYKMGLRDTAAVIVLDCPETFRLSQSQLPQILELYSLSYPDNWFDPIMLETNQYFGILKGKTLVSIAGIHVYSRQYRVAALGNIATHPSFRNKGYGRCVTARLCQSLLKEVDHIGLNVRSDNIAAIKCYEGLGFDIAASYGEFMIERRR